MGFTPTKIIVHHSLTKDSGTVSWGAIRRYHTTPKPQGMGMLDIGYHAGVELVETAGIKSYEILMGRMWDVQGAHTIGQNFCSLGICFVGNFDLAVPSGLALMTGAKVIRLWMYLFKIRKDSIFPHRDFAAKTCPGNLFDMNELKSLV